jgi:hypothetical protein
VWVSHRWARQSFAGILAETRESFEEGRALGANVPPGACLDTAFARHPAPAAQSMRHEIGEGIFLEGCLRASQGGYAELCDTIPSGGVKGVIAFSAWSARQCHLHNSDDRSCPRVLQAVYRYCTKRTA